MDCVTGCLTTVDAELSDSDDNRRARISNKNFESKFFKRYLHKEIANKPVITVPDSDCDADITVLDLSVY